MPDNCTLRCGAGFELGPCADMCVAVTAEVEVVDTVNTGSDIVQAVIAESDLMNMLMYVLMSAATLVLVSYAVYLSVQLVTRGHRSLSSVNLARDYQPVPATLDME